MESYPLNGLGFIVIVNHANKGVVMKKKLLLTLLASVMACLWLSQGIMAAKGIYVPLFTYRTGAYAGSGIPIANGLSDYLNMLNERDGGIGGVPLIVEECETGYNTKKGVECYEKIKPKNPVVINPFSTGITLQLIPKSPVDKIPVHSMGYGLSAAADGSVFPWVFNYPSTYWNQASAIIKYIGHQEGGISNLKGKKIGFIYLESGYGREPIPLFEQLSSEMGFKLFKIAVAGKEMQNQSSHWLKVRKEKPDWMIMWGWGAMNPTAIKEATRIKFNMEKFIGVWWSGGEDDARPAGKAAKGYKSANFHGIGAEYPAIKDILRYVVDKGKSQVKDRSRVGENFYMRGIFNSVLIAEAIRTAQGKFGNRVISSEEMRWGMENLNLTSARLAEIGLPGFTNPIKVSCDDHANNGPIYIQQWNGTSWERVSGWISSMDRVRPMLINSAAKYKEKNNIPDRTIPCS